MSEAEPPTRPEIALLKDLYAAIKRNDFTAAVGALDQDMEWIETPDLPGGATYRGQAQLLGHIAKRGNGWAGGACLPERFIPVGDKIVVFVRARSSPKEGVHCSDLRFAEVYTFLNGRPVRMQSFIQREAALKSAGAQFANAEELAKKALIIEDFDDASAALADLGQLDSLHARDVALKILTDRIGDSHYQGFAFSVLYTYSYKDALDYIRLFATSAPAHVFGTMLSEVAVDIGAEERAADIMKVVPLLRNTLAARAQDETCLVLDDIAWFERTFNDD